MYDLISFIFYLFGCCLLWFIVAYCFGGLFCFVVWVWLYGLFDGYYLLLLLVVYCGLLGCFGVSWAFVGLVLF